jgi:ElaB/YqjD/DUF883 family membrane-anchored ribosome-binding protein
MASSTSGTERVPSAIPSTSSSPSALGSRSETADKTSDKATDALSSVTERGGEAVSGFQEVGGNIADVVADSVRNQPMATIVIAVGVGFVLGALWKT